MSTVSGESALASLPPYSFPGRQDEIDPRNVPAPDRETTADFPTDLRLLAGQQRAFLNPSSFHTSLSAMPSLMARSLFAARVWTGDADLESRRGHATWHAPFDVAALLVGTCRFMRWPSAMSKLSVCAKAPSLTLPRFAV